jgi:DNA-binding response OmpR family regulator
MRILVVEDDTPIAAVIRLGLRGAGHVVDLAPDGIAGLRAASVEPYDLVILDLALPGLDGWHVCGELRSSGNRVPVLMLSAYDSPDDRVRGFEAGADDYLPKPFCFRELLARVEALHRRCGHAAQPELLAA